jgi:NAD(P)H-hydrate epimerase
MMAAEAALRVGVGLVSVATRAAHVAPLLIRRPEAMAQGVRGAAEIAVLSERASVLLIGPGLGQSPWSEQLLHGALAAAIDADKPLVADADALNLIARNRPELPNRLVMTPHPGEAARLLGCDTSEIAADRVGALKELVERYHAIVVLKGVGSLIAEPVGLVGVCTLGNPGMASAGMGDVLAGLTAGLVAQFDCTAATLANAVAIHAAAGDLAVLQLGELSLLASDLLAAIPKVISANQSVARPERDKR